MTTISNFFQNLKGHTLNTMFLNPGGSLDLHIDSISRTSDPISDAAITITIKSNWMIKSEGKVILDSQSATAKDDVILNKLKPQRITDIKFENDFSELSLVLENGYNISSMRSKGWHCLVYFAKNRAYFIIDEEGKTKVSGEIPNLS